MRSKSWDEFAQPDAPQIDFLFTVCNSAADEACPVWPGKPMTAHWAIPDPTAAQGTDADLALAFEEAYRILSKRIELFTSLPLDKLHQITMQAELREISRIEGAISPRPRVA